MQDNRPTGYLWGGNPGKAASITFFSILYLLGMIDRASEYSIGKTASVPLIVPVVAFGKVSAIGFGCEFLVFGLLVAKALIDSGSMP